MLNSFQSDTTAHERNKTSNALSHTIVQGIHKIVPISNPEWVNASYHKLSSPDQSITVVSIASWPHLNPFARTLILSARRRLVFSGCRGGPTPAACDLIKLSWSSLWIETITHKQWNSIREGNLIHCINATMYCTHISLSSSTTTRANFPNPVVTPYTTTAQDNQ